MLIVGTVPARRFQATLEIGKCFDVSPFAFPRREGIDFAPRPKVPDRARQQPLGGAHAKQRKVRDIMPEADREAAYLVDEERAKVDVRENKFCARNVMVETAPKPREHPPSATVFIRRQREETDEQNDRDEDWKEGRHGT